MSVSETTSKFFSEREINNLVQSCNELLARTTFEQDQLKKKTLEVQKDTLRLLSANQALTKQQRTMKAENDQKEFILQEKNKSLQYLKTLSNILNNLESVKDNEIEQSPEWVILEQQISDKTLSINSIYTKDSPEYKQRDQLQIFYQEIQNEVVRLKNDIKFWNCKRCNIQLKENENDKVQRLINIKSCVYHPGRLKYYSCRSCGEDEYFTCCNNCRKCSLGCFTGQHQQ